MYKNKKFDFDKALKSIQKGDPILGRNGILTPLIKELTEAALEAELDSHLSQEIFPNRRNGKTSKTIKSLNGNFKLNTPRDRAGSFNPKIIKKNQTRLSDEIEGKIISMYGFGMSYKDISLHIEEIYGLKLSKSSISNITNKIIKTVKKWQSRSLEAIYPIVWLDAIFYKIRDNGKIKTSAVYSVLGINLEGRKDILDLYIYKSETSSFWAQVLKDLSNRGVNNILIACIDGLKGFPEVIKSIFPKTKIQLCIIHQIRNSLKQIDKKDKTKFRKDLKKIYIASTEQIANISLDNLISKWRETYPIVIKSWENNWNNLNEYFKYSKKIRKIIYTTNAIESVHRQFRKLTKSKSVFPDKNSLLKLLYLGIKNIKNKWSMPINNWNSVVNELKI